MKMKIPNLITPLIDRIKSSGTGNASRLLGVQIVEGEIQLVCAAREKDRVVINRMTQKKISKDNDAEITSFLSESLKQLKVRGKIEELILVLPASEFISKNVDVPSRDGEEIRKIVELQANRNTPYSRDELVVDYLCMQTPNEHYTNVLLIVVNRAMIERYFKAVEAAALAIDCVSIAAEGMSSPYYQLAKTSSPEEVICGIHISGEVSDLTILERKQAVFIRSIPIGARQIREKKEEASLEFLRELNKSMVAYQNQRADRPLKQVVVTGNVKELDFLKEEMRQSIPYLFASNIPVSMVPYEHYFKLTNQSKADLAHHAGTSFFEVLSCLSMRRYLMLDLTPGETKLKRRFRERGRNIISIGVTIMSFFLAFSIFLATKIYFKRSFLEKLNVVYNSTVEKTKLLEDASTQSRFLESFLQEKGKPIYVYEKIADLIGSDIYLSNFSIGSDNMVKLVGTADSLSRVFNFVTELESSGYLSGVKTNQTKSRKQGDKDVADFEIECKFMDHPEEK